MERKPHGYWNEWEHIREALEPVVKKLGYLPGQSELRRHRLSSLSLVIRKHFGGFCEVAKRLSVPTAKEFRSSKLHDWQIFEEEIWPIINRYGRMPSKSELLRIGRSDIVNAIRKYHGGQDEVANRLGVPTYNKEHGLHDCGHWTVERTVDKYIQFIEKYQFSHWPSPSDLREKGYGDLEGAVRKIGHRKFRKMIEERGISLEQKPRRLDHLIPFERQYEILPEVFQECELKYFFLGLMSSDGHIISRKNEQAVELCLNKVDVGILEKLRDRISPDRPIHVKPHKENSDSDAVRFKLSGFDIVSLVGKYMPLYQKSLALTYPGNIPDEFFRHFLRGVCDGDSNINVKRGQKVVQRRMKCYYFTRLRILGTEDFLSGLTKTINRLIGIAPVQVRKKGKENVYQIEYTGQSADRILEEMYRDAEFFIERKFRVWRYIKENSHELPKIFGKPEGRLNYRAKTGTL